MSNQEIINALSNLDKVVKKEGGAEQIVVIEALCVLIENHFRALEHQSIQLNKIHEELYQMHLELVEIKRK